jgi:hypothetical protein
MKLPEYLEIEMKDSRSIRHIKTAVNALLRLHYEVHDIKNGEEFNPVETFKPNQNGNGGGC